MEKCERCGFWKYECQCERQVCTDQSVVPPQDAGAADQGGVETNILCPACDTLLTIHSIGPCSAAVLDVPPAELFNSNPLAKYLPELKRVECELGGMSLFGPDLVHDWAQGTQKFICDLIDALEGIQKDSAKTG